MQRRTIIFLGVLAAIIFDVMYLWTMDGLNSGLLRVDRARLIVNSLGIYAGFVLLMTTALALRDMHRLRLRLSQPRPPDQQQWAAAFAGTALSRLPLRLLALAPTFGQNSTRPPSLNAGECRQEILRLYWDSLVRAQFATVLAGFLAIAVVASAQSNSQIPNLGAALPLEWTLTTTSAVLTLAALSWVVIGSAAEKLLDVLGSLAFESRRTLAESTSESSAADADSLGLREPLTTLLEENRQAFWQASARIVESTDRLARMMETRSDKAPARNGFDSQSWELKTAIDRLTATINGLPKLAQSTVTEVENLISQPSHSENLRRDIRALLKQFD